MTDNKSELEKLAQERNKAKMEERLNRLASGDLTRGFGGGIKDRNTVDSTYSQHHQIQQKQAEKQKELERQQQLEKDRRKSESIEKNTALTKEEKVAAKKKKKALGNIIVDENAVEVLANTRADSRSGRNKLIIAILLIIIVLIWVFIIVTRFIKPKEPEHNCHMYLNGNAKSNCELLLNGKNNTSWRTPSGIAPEAQYTEIDIQLNIKQNGAYDLKFRIEVFKENLLLENFGILDMLTTFDSETDSDGLIWYTMDNISGGQKISILNGITFMDIRSNYDMFGLTSSNIKIDIYVEVNYSN